MKFSILENPFHQVVTSCPHLMIEDFLLQLNCFRDERSFLHHIYLETERLSFQLHIIRQPLKCCCRLSGIKTVLQFNMGYIDVAIFSKSNVEADPADFWEVDFC